MCNSWLGQRDRSTAQSQCLTVLDMPGHLSASQVGDLESGMTVFAQDYRLTMAPQSAGRHHGNAELAEVSPQMHYEFVMQYEKPLLEPFGLTGYGCCEDLTLKLDFVTSIPNMRRISISPWAHVDTCADKLKGNYIFSWKPQPSHLCGDFNPGLIETYLRHTLKVCRDNGCVLEIILKDTHTCEQKPERFDEWARIARKLTDEYGEGWPVNTTKQ